MKTKLYAFNLIWSRLQLETELLTWVVTRNCLCCLAWHQLCKWVICDSIGWWSCIHLRHICSTAVGWRWGPKVSVRISSCLGWVPRITNIWKQSLCWLLATVNSLGCRACCRGCAIGVKCLLKGVGKTRLTCLNHSLIGTVWIIVCSSCCLTQSRHTRQCTCLSRVCGRLCWRVTIWVLNWLYHLVCPSCRFCCGTACVPIRDCVSPWTLYYSSWLLKLSQICLGRGRYNVRIWSPAIITRRICTKLCTKLRSGTVRCDISRVSINV